MTRARALKIAIRSRAAKTGERYTTARRHVLQALTTEVVEPPRPSRRSLEPPEPTPISRVAPSAAKGSVSDARCREKTGHGLAHWFELLDRFGAVAKGHTASARHLRDAFGIDGWYSQGITVAYERARGVRAVNQRCDGVYEVSVSKVMPVEPRRVMAALGKRGRKGWASGADAALVAALAAALDAPSSKGFVLRDDGQARCRYKWDDTTVEIRMLPRAGGQTTLTVQHMKLSGPEMLEARRAQWRTTVQAVAAHLDG